MLNHQLNAHRGFIPRRFVPPQTAITPEQEYIIIMINAGAVLGDRFMSPPSSFPCFEFHIRVKGILHSRSCN